MFHAAIAQCALSLRQVEVWLDRAEQHANAKQFDLSVLLHSRLAPDQHGFIYQVQSACDYVKGAAAWLSGEAVPSHADTEQTVGELRERVRKTLAFVDGIAPAQYASAAQRQVRMSWVPGKHLSGEDYLLQMAIPNVYFHLVTAYAILRHNGVDVGKLAFLGPARFVEG